MSALVLEGLNEDARGRVGPFVTEALEAAGDNIHSVYVTGSALTADYQPGVSDVNSVFVLKEMDLKFLEALAPMGRKFRKKGVAAPLIMTPGYIKSSADVFPIEFLNTRLLHLTVLGEDLFGTLEIAMPDLRVQCERDLKFKLVTLRQGYLSTMGDMKVIAEGLASAIRGYIPLFRGIIALKGAEPPLLQAEVITGLSKATGVDCGVFERVLRWKGQKLKHTAEELIPLFEGYYRATDELVRVVDEIAV